MSPRSPHTLVASLAVALAAPLFPGCMADHEANKPQTPPAARSASSLNAATAAEKLQQATDAEQHGDYHRALEAYDQLRSYPESFRPADLEKRIEAVRQKVQPDRPLPSATTKGLGGAVD